VTSPIDTAESDSLVAGLGWRGTLAAILVMAGVVRFWGLSYGLPHPVTRPDEEIVVGHALDLSLGTVADRQSFPYPDLLYLREPVRGRATTSLRGFAYPYPDLVYDIDAAVFAAWRKAGEWVGTFPRGIGFIEHLVRDQPRAAYLVCRSVSAVCGVLAVFATFLAASWGYGRRSVGLLAALLVAVNFLHARDSHYATVDVPMTLMATMALAFSARGAASGRSRDLLSSGVFVGLAASAKFNGVAVALSTAYAGARQFFAASSSDARARTIRMLVYGGIAAIAVFAVTSPWCVAFYKTVHLGLRIQRRVLFSSPGPPAAWTFLTNTLPNAFGWPAFLLALGGGVRAAVKRRPGDLVLLVFIVPTFASMAAMTWVLPRYPLPLIPPLAILGAELLVASLPARVAKSVVAIVVAVLIAPPLIRIVRYDQLAARPDTRLLAGEWIAANIPSHARIAVCRGYGAPVVNRDEHGTPAFERVDLLPCTRQTIASANARYAVTHTHPAIPYFAPDDTARVWLASRARPLATFSPFAGPETQTCFYPGDAFYLPYCNFSDVQRGGPVITVWELPTGP
jgi:dolichyl-phosphate-mannose-protein mannosyltransferase